MFLCFVVGYILLEFAVCEVADLGRFLLMFGLVLCFAVRLV